MTDNSTAFQRIRRSDFLRSLPFWGVPTLLLGVFVYGGILWNFVLSLTDFEGLSLPTYDVTNFDFEMYAELFSDSSFWTATQNTVAFLVAFTVITLIVGLLLAILLDQKIRFKGVFRTVYLLPFSLSFVVTGVLWLWMFNYNVGVINSILRGAGLGFLAQHWLSNPSLQLGSVVIALVWQYSGYAMVIYLANLQRIPTEHYEAAKIDGASWFSTYREVIIPQLNSAAVSIAVVVMVFALKAFSWLYVVFGDNPGPAADILATMMYREAFVANQWAYGAAVGTLLFAVSIAIVGPYLFWQYRRGEL